MNRLTLSVLLAAVAVLLAAGSARALGPTNPSTLTWDCPTKNADGTPLTDLKEYRIDLATQSPTGPWTQVAVIPSATAAPATGCTGTSPVGAWGNLAPGQYYAALRACDTGGNCSTEAVASPFAVADVLAPSPPTNLRFQ